MRAVHPPSMFKSLCDKLHLGIVIYCAVDTRKSDYRLMYANDYADEACGFKITDLVGGTYRNLFPAAVEDTPYRTLCAAVDLQEHVHMYNSTYTHTDGTEVIVSAEIFPLSGVSAAIIFSKSGKYVREAESAHGKITELIQSIELTDADDDPELE